MQRVWVGAVLWESERLLRRLLMERWIGKTFRLIYRYFGLLVTKDEATTMMLGFGSNEESILSR